MVNIAKIIGRVMVEEDGTIYILDGYRMLWYHLKTSESFEIAYELLHVFAKRVFEKYIKYVREVEELENEIKQMENETEYWEPTTFISEENALERIEKRIENYVERLERKYRMLEEKEEKCEKLREIIKELADARIKLMEVYDKTIEFLVMD